MSSNRTTTQHVTRGLAMFGAGALVFQAWRLALTLGGAPTRYVVDRRRLSPLDSEEFRNYVSSLTDAQVRAARILLLRNGEEFYPAELQAIRAARHSINLEAYGFLEGEVTRAFLQALTERARTGVEVRVVLDAIGSWRTRSRYFDALRAAGGRVAWYHPINSRDWPYVNHRTHRKLLVVDAAVGFIGGAGFADHWLDSAAGGPGWRDTMLRAEGGVVSGLNSVFAENWLETTGEILAGAAQFRFDASPNGVSSVVISSTPHGGTTRARMLYQTLLEAARESIWITTPYFVPDRSARKALMRAAGRGVAVKILTAGPHSDHAMTRRLSRMFDEPLARAGAEIYEYQPSMIHAKLMTIDGLWTVAGSTNFDHRSFDLNDEVNIVICDRALTSQVNDQFRSDLQQSRQLTLRRLKNQNLSDRMIEDARWVIRREE